MSAAPEAGERLRLTVVIPNYNHAAILPRAIASVLAQSGPETEILVVDDGSKDHSVELITELASRHPAIRLIRHAANAGAPAALNTGLEAARGDYISFLGADDVALAGLYDTMIDALESHPAAPLACGEIVTFDAGDRLHGLRPIMPPAREARYFSPDDVMRHVRGSDNWICNTVTVYRTPEIRETGGFDPALGAFCDGFLVRQLAFAQGFCFVPGIYGGWQVAADTLSATSMLRPEENRRLTNLLTTRLRESVVGRQDPDYPALYRRRWQFSTARLRLVWKQAQCEPAELVEAVDGNDFDRRVLSGIRKTIGFSKAGRLGAMAWLTLRVRPFPLRLVAMHAVRNRLLLRRNSARIKAQLGTLKAAGARLTGGG